MSKFQMTNIQIAALTYACQTFGEFMEKAVKEYGESRTASTMRQELTRLRKFGVPLKKLRENVKQEKQNVEMSDADYLEISTLTGVSVEQLKADAAKAKEHAAKAGAAVKAGKEKAKLAAANTETATS